ncbi:hypothetical protein [Dongia sp.]|uniref:hypothetical protein n=1 Tax=Dongia sp. TaxID=1977262 RepID=UPI0035B0D6FF
MGKALLIGGNNASVASGSETNFFGALSNSTESNCQYSATEGADFTGLGVRIASGGSGSNTVQFRKNGANGQNVVSRTGAGTAEDTTHTDTLSAGDLFNLAMTDTGTTPNFRWFRANVQFASGHGCFHAAASVATCDVPSSTRYLPISGTLVADGQATIANVQWKNRGYTSLEAFQIFVNSNLRLNDSVFSVNINGVDVGTPITFGAGATGLQTVTGMGISLADGDLICISMTLGAGLEDLVLFRTGATLKSTNNNSDAVCGSAFGSSITASGTPTYVTAAGSLLNLSDEANQRVKVGFAARIKNLRCYLSANTYSANATLKLMVNGSAVITTTITASGGAGWYENSSDYYDIDDNDEISYEIVGGTSGSITVHSIGVTFAEIPASGPVQKGSHSLLGVGA